VEYVTLKDFADRLGLDRSSARKWLLAASRAEGIEPVNIRPPGAGGQSSLAWSAADAARLMERRVQAGFIVGEKPGTVPAVPNGKGFIYLIQLVPEYAPGRIKIGFADTVDRRLREHMTAAPTATVLKSWPARLSWEGMALNAVASVASRRLSAEVFEVPDLDAAVTRLDRLFEAAGAPV
jgi:hypothetical protein